MKNTDDLVASAVASAIKPQQHAPLSGADMTPQEVDAVVYFFYRLRDWDLTRFCSCSPTIPASAWPNAPTHRS